MAAPELPDILPAPKAHGRVWGFVRRHPAIAVGGALVALMLLMALLAPYLWTVDPTTLATHRRTREPSAAYWFGTDMLGRDIYSRVLYGARALADPIHTGRSAPGRRTRARTRSP